MAVTGTGTGVLTFSASNDSVSGVYVLKSCRWVGATGAGQLCRLEDSKGNVFFQSEADGANYVDGWYFDDKWVDGISIASMNSGTLNLYLR